MKRIEVTDLIGKKSDKKEHKSIDLPEIQLQAPKTNIYDKFYNIEPENDLERCIVAKTAKEKIAQKTRQNIILAQFDSKMRRMNKIKSKTYRKMKRKEKIKLIESEEAIKPTQMIQKHIENNANNENTEMDENVTGDANEYIVDENINVEMLKNKSALLNKLLQRNKQETHETQNVMRYKADEKQREIVKNMFLQEESKNRIADCVADCNADSSADCNDEFVSGFAAEKSAVNESEMPAIVKEILPGWNSWGGAGIETVETKYNTIITRKEGISIENRKDYKQSHVIVNENNAKLDEKYVAVLPYGYTKQDYKTKIDMPVSKEYNTLRMFNKLVREEGKQKEKEVFEYEQKYDI